MMPTRTIPTLLLALLPAAPIAGCGLAYRTYYDEGGSGASLDRYTWISTPHQPKTVMLVDTRTEEVFWSVDIPVGQQLTLRFEEDQAEDNTQTSALMHWDLQDAGTRFRRLQNAQLVPGADVRRIDWELRPAPEPYGV